MTLRHTVVFIPGFLDKEAMFELFEPLTIYLSSKGARTYVVQPSTMETLENRTAQIRNRIAHDFQGQTIHLVGHSMGGLNARQIARMEDLPFVVRSVTTIATPHHGVSFLETKIVEFADKHGQIFGRLRDTLATFTPQNMQNFDAEYPDNPNIPYLYLAGKAWHIGATWERTLDGLDMTDYVVPVTSAIHGRGKTITRANHFTICNNHETFEFIEKELREIEHN